MRLDPKPIKCLPAYRSLQNNLIPEPVKEIKTEFEPIAEKLAMFEKLSGTKITRQKSFEKPRKLKPCKRTFSMAPEILHRPENTKPVIVSEKKKPALRNLKIRGGLNDDERQAAAELFAILDADKSYGLFLGRRRMSLEETWPDLIPYRRKGKENKRFRD